MSLNQAVRELLKNLEENEGDKIQKEFDLFLVKLIDSEREGKQSLIKPRVIEDSEQQLRKDFSSLAFHS